MQGFASLCYGAAAVGGRVYSGQVSAQMCALATDLVIYKNLPFRPIADAAQVWATF